MTAFKFKLGEPREVILAFDKPKEGTNNYGNWYLYGIKNGDVSSEEDAFFATQTLHTMIQTVGAGVGDKIKIEKCQEGGVDFFKVNDLFDSQKFHIETSQVDNLINATTYMDYERQRRSRSFGEDS